MIKAGGLCFLCIVFQQMYTNNLCIECHMETYTVGHISLGETSTKS